MTNKDIYDLYEGLVEISQDKQLKFSIQTSYFLAYNKKTLEPFYQAIIETRNNLFEQYGSQTEDGWKIPNINVDTFQKEWSDFMRIQNQIDLRSIKLNEITGQINIDLMGKLLPIIKI